jgi:hypothetical protein
VREWKKKSLKTFVEVGAGNGLNSRLFLSQGLSGVAYDLNPEACRQNKERNKTFAELGSFRVLNQDFLTSPALHNADVIFSSMVIEHFGDDQLAEYFERCKSNLRIGGLIVSIVPANMDYWGIEDEIAGHYKRYSLDCFREIARQHQLEINSITGLTFPISNVLLGLSNRLVEKSEKNKLDLSLDQRTALSGNRSVRFKTHFPLYMKAFLNEYTLYPFHLMQRIFGNDKRSMVIYCELKHGN